MKGHQTITIPPGDPLVGKSVKIFSVKHGVEEAATVVKAYMDGKQHRIRYVILGGPRKGKTFDATYGETDASVYDDPKDALAALMR